ncbi:serine/threonine protein kinase [Yoonia litorea]|nr:serine/threonine-protein kinase [Yoonia litorea]
MSGQYEITGYLNHGGFGLTYLANDSLGRPVVIKECFPQAMCRRSRLAVQARSRAHQKDVESVIRLFIKEAQALSKLEHPNIVGVHQVFEENGTAYMVLDFVDGADLLTYIENPGKQLTPRQIRTTLSKVLDAIAFVHDAGILHRDISPDNIILTKSFEPILIDFGAARQKASKATQALSALRVVKDGYSPQEFYLAGSTQSPSSDLYSLAATFYHLASGEIPPDSQIRLNAHVANEGDPYVPLGNKTDGYDAAFCAAIDKALAILPRDRIQSANEWRHLLEVAQTSKGSRSMPKVPSRRLAEQVRTMKPSRAILPTPTKAAKKKTKRLPALAIGTAALAVLVASSLWAPNGGEASAPVVATSLPEISNANSTEAPAAPVLAPLTDESTTLVVQAPVEPVQQPTPTLVQPSSPTPERLDLRTVWAEGQITIDWHADLPFALDESGTVTWIDGARLDIPAQARLVVVNGLPVNSRDAAMAAIEEAVNNSDGHAVTLNLAWAAPQGADMATTTVAADVVYQTRFENGLAFESRFMDEGWRTELVGLEGNPDVALQMGDEIIALLPENQRLESATALAEFTEQAWAESRTSMQFAVRRNNSLWIADVALKAGD